MNSEVCCHVLLVSFPSQGHVNPTLRLAKKLAAKGLLVTFTTTQNFGRLMKKANQISEDDNESKPTPFGHGFIRFEFFHDGYEDEDSPITSFEDLMARLERAGRVSLSQIIKKQSEENRPVSCIVGNPFIPWVCDVSNDLEIPCAILWVQSCSVFAVYYHYFHDSGSFFPSENDVNLPCLPVLKQDEIPSFLLSSNDLKAIANCILGQIQNLTIPFCIFLDTFEDLESEIIKYMSKLCPIKTVGPLFKMLDFETTLLSADCMKADDGCLDWLSSKPPKSVVYVSFGSVVHLKQEQVDEIAYGLERSGFTFLWVLKPPSPRLGVKPNIVPVEILEKIGDRAKMVQWCPQEQVLSHPSVACFLTHCGWNSSVEALCLGIPMIVFPQWGDQVTNAKFLVDEFKVGLRLCRGVAENRLVLRDEIESCLKEAMVGYKAEEIKLNALKWRHAAEKAVVDGGSSDQNIVQFIDHIRKTPVHVT